METRDLNTSCRQYEEMDASPQERHQVDSNIEASNNVVNKSTTDQKEGNCEDDLGKSNVVLENKGEDDGKLKPEVGMEFETVEDAYNLYNQFGSLRGFSIRKHNSTKDKKTGVVKMRKFVCSNEGHRGPDRRNSNVKHHRDETRTGCLCYMMIILGENGKYHVSNFLDDHNHPLVSPDKIHMLRSQRKLVLSQDPVSDDCNKSGMQQKQLFRKQAGQINVGFHSANYRSCLQAKRTKAMEIIDAGDLLEYFKRKQVEDPMFFHSIQVDADDCITNVFWADARMLMDYERFGDVVCLDTTYRKTGCGRPFALFIGINNHKQIVIFGTALLYDETTESFGWLFSTFCEAMSGKKPLTIFTDQDNVISIAIEEELPGTTHRICVWHVFQNALEQLNHVFQGSQSFGKDFSKCIYDYEEEEDFLAAWDDMLEQYSLRDNTWLAKLFEEKEKWALVYGKSAFSADMKSSLRNESMNKELKTYLDPKNRITDFFYYFERLLDDRRNAELEANFTMSQISSCIRVPVDILKHAANVYTSTIFKMIETEFVNGLDWKVEETSDVGAVQKYNVFNGKGRKHIVTFNPVDESITCSCKKFESAGILCGHSLKATMRKLQHIPEKYILKRWTREAVAYPFKPSSDGCKPRENKKDLSGRYSALLCSFVRIAAKAAESRETFECVAKFTELMFGDIEKISRLHGPKDGLKGVECSGDKVVNEDNNAELMVDNAPLEDMNGNKRKENYHDGHKMETYLEKGSQKRRRKKLSQMMNAISSNKCSTPAHNHASNHRPNFLSHGTYGTGMNPAQYHAPTHPPTLISHGLFGSGMMPIYYNDQYHSSTHPQSLISQENLPVNYFQDFQQRSSEDR